MILESSGITFSEECSKENSDPEVVDQSLPFLQTLLPICSLDSCKLRSISIPSKFLISLILIFLMNVQLKLLMNYSF